MTTIAFVQSAIDWLLADPSHVVLAASVLAALIPTPDPNTLIGKLYRVIDILAINILRAKQTGTAATSPTPIPPGAARPDVKQAGFSSLAAAALATAAGAMLMLAGCTGVQSAVSAANASVVQAAMGAGQDQLTLGKELICGAPYQVVANAMVNDSGFGTAVPGLCPATKSVPVTVPGLVPPPASASPAL